MMRLASALLAIGLAGPAAATPPPIMGANATAAEPPISPESAAKVGTLPAGAAPGSVVVRGLGPKAETLTAADIAKLPHEHVLISHGGTTADYAGPPLSDLLRDVDAPMGVRLHGAGVNDVVFVTGSDRFRAVFSLAELDPAFHKGARAILADQVGGKPLTGKEAPFRLIVDGDLKTARSVYAVVAIELKHLP